MRWSDIQFDPPRKVLRQFAGLWLLFFGGLALWEILRRGRIGFGGILAVLAVTIGPTGVNSPCVGSIHLRWLDGPGFPDRLDHVTDHSGDDVFRTVHADWIRVPASRA